MTGCAVFSDLVVMISSIIVCVVIRRGVAGLADAVPGCTIAIESKVVRALLEDRKVKGTVNVPCFFPDEA